MSQREFQIQRMENYLRGRLAEEKFSSETPFRASLTISRECGCGTDRIRRNLIEYLDTIDESAVHGWALFDQPMIGKVVEENRLPSDTVSFDPEETKFPISQLLAESLQLPTDQWTLFNHTAFTIRRLCRMGNAIILGRASNFVTSDLENTFHVRLIGSNLARTNYTSNRYRMKWAEANQLVAKVDGARRDFVRRHADAEIDDLRSYHLVLNTDHLSDEVVVRIIGDSLIEWASDRELQLRSSFPKRVQTSAPSR